MTPHMNRLLRAGLLLVCMMSYGGVLRHITTRDSEYSATNLPIKVVRLAQRPNRDFAEILPQQVTGNNHDESPSTTPQTVNRIVECAKPIDRKNDCEVVHIAITSWGTSATRDTALLLKSIFLHRRGPLQFHIFSDQIATIILTELLRSWRIHKVSYVFYDLEMLKKKYAFESLFTSGDARLLVQLALPDILPKEVDKVLVLNSDRMVAVDVRELWSVFSCFKQSQSLGAVVWQKNTTIGAGLLLLHVERLRVGGWSTKMQELRSNLSALVADSNGKHLEQLTLSILYRLFPHLFYNLPCQYNHPAATTEHECPIDVKHAMVFEFISGRVPERFWKVFLKVVRYDGSLMRRPAAQACGTNEPDGQDDKSSYTMQMKLVDAAGSRVCKDYVRELIDTFRTHLFYHGSTFDFDDFDDVTLVTQLNIGRISTLEKLCGKWHGPMSVAIYLADRDTMHFMSFLQNSKAFSSRKNVAFHLLYEEGSFYPTNHLRNTAVAQVKTSHVLVLDVDFMPNPSLYEDLRQAIKLQRLKDAKSALLIPAFETDDYSIVFPDTKEKLLPMLDAGVLYPFRNKTCVRGHRATNYTAWKTASEPFEIKWERGFEPYFAVRTKELPRYRESFMGYGKNKIVHVMEVAAHGYSFYVMPNMYLIHLPHRETFERTRHKRPEIKTCMKILEEDVARELLGRHGNNSLNGWNPDITMTPSARRTLWMPAETQLTPTTMRAFSPRTTAV